MFINANDSNQNKEQERYCYFIVFVVFSIFATNALYILSSGFGINFDGVSLLLKIFLGLLFIYIVIKKPMVSVRFLLLTFFVLGVWILNYLVFPLLRSTTIDYAMNFWSVCFMPVFVIVRINDFSLLLRRLIEMARFIACFSFIIVLFSFAGLVSVSSQAYYMGFGYSLLLPVLLLIYDCASGVTIKKVILLIAGTISIFVLGSRGPLLSIAVYMCFFLLHILLSKRGKYSSRIKKLCFVVIVLIVLIVMFFDPLITLLHDILARHNIYSRSLNALVSGVIDDSGRAAIYMKVRDGIFSDPISIKGIGSELLILDGIYAHNIFYEIIYQFGVLLGGLILLFLVLLMIKTVTFLSGDEERKSFIRIVFFAAFPKLFLSASFWNEYSFWIWLILLIVTSPRGNKEDRK